MIMVTKMSNGQQSNVILSSEL